MSAGKSTRIFRCGHFEQVKSGHRWKCVACGRVLSLDESIQGSLEVSDMMKGAFENRKPLAESLDELLGRKEWEEMRSKIRVSRKRVRQKSKGSRERSLA